MLGLDGVTLPPGQERHHAATMRVRQRFVVPTLRAGTITASRQPRRDRWCARRVLLLPVSDVSDTVVHNQVRFTTFVRARAGGDDRFVLSLPQSAVERVSPGPTREAFVPLLLLADESEAQVRSYYQRGDLYVLWAEEAGESRVPLGVVLALPSTDGETTELKAVAVAAEWHGQGIGQRMLSLVLDRLRAQGVRRVIVGTGNSGIGQLAFYQKAGFRLSQIERDFFTPARGYPADAEENGIPLRDMVWMDQAL